jgi:CHAT domain-containing protein
LWAVNDLSKALLMIEFYQNTQQGLSVHLALNKAQKWLRSATKEELLAWIESQPFSLNQKEELSDMIHEKGDIPQPFQAPYYWAAFCVIGK